MLEDFVTQFFRYLWAHMRYPSACRLGVVGAGLGIESRRKHFAKSWDEHFEHSRVAQRRWLEETRLRSARAGTLVLFGAGRLYDFEASLIHHFEKIVFVDADPLCKSAWQNFSKKHALRSPVFEIREITGLLESWQRSFFEIIKRAPTETTLRWDFVLKGLENITLPNNENDFPSFLETLSPPVSVISLNLLSQIPILWQNIVEQTLFKSFSKTWVLKHEGEWISAYAASAKLLIKQHLEMLDYTRFAEVLVITDLEYTYSSTSPNEKVSALVGLESLSQPNIFGIQLHHSYLELNTWQWQIVPQHEIDGNDREESQEITSHRVGAFVREKRI